jgi:hypothetical protein
MLADIARKLLMTSQRALTEQRLFLFEYSGPTTSGNVAVGRLCAIESGSSEWNYDEKVND